MRSAGLTFCDLSLFYCETGGGIRMYHRARLDWFARQSRHRYALVCPGPRSDVTMVGPSVTIVRIYGPRLTADPLGYRLPLSYAFARDAIRHLRPDVVETGDCWISGPLGLFLRRQRAFRGVLSSFCHSDAIATYVEPFVSKMAAPMPLKRRIASAAGRLLDGAQRKFDVTLVASEFMRRRLNDRGLNDVVKAAFGVDSALFGIPRRARAAGDATRMLYAGRLDADKDIALIKGAVRDLLRADGVSVTVVGKGREEKFFASLSHPRFRFVPFVADRAAMHRIYAEHDVLLAPGRFETFGLSALEAMAAGAVVVGPDVGGTAELLRQQDSPFMFIAGDQASFIERAAAAARADLWPYVTGGRALARGVYGTWPEAVSRQTQLYESMA